MIQASRHARTGLMALSLAWLALCPAHARDVPQAEVGRGLSLQLVDGTGAPVKGAVASLHAVDGRSLLAPDAPPGEAVVEQTRGEFSPALTVVDVGTGVRFPNLDRVRHHVYSFSRAKTFELPLYSGEPHEPVVFDQAGIVTLGCNIHDWMLAHVLVMDTPWRAHSDAGGQLRLAPPVGDYVLRVWHPGLPAGQAVVELPVTLDDAGHVRRVTLDLSQPPLRRLRAAPARVDEYQ